MGPGLVPQVGIVLLLINGRYAFNHLFLLVYVSKYIIDLDHMNVFKIFLQWKTVIKDMILVFLTWASISTLEI